MKDHKKVSRMLAFAVVVLGVFATAVGVQFHKAFANGESFTPFTLSPSVSYDQSHDTVSLSGTVTDGTETFKTQAKCENPTQSDPAYPWVTGPMDVANQSWSITNAAGQTVARGGGPTFYSMTGVSSSSETFNFPCGATHTEDTVYSLNTVNPIDASSWPSGTYTFTLLVNGTCEPSTGYSTCSSSSSTSATWSGPFTISSFGGTTPRTPSVSASCDPSSVSVNGTSACSATVANLSSQDVTWTATAGSIDASGNFTAPSTAGTVSVTACSTVDPSVCGSTNITVASRSSFNATGTITVTSENANDQSVSVPAEWDISGNVPGGFICSAANDILWENSIPCSGTSEVYPNLPADDDIYDVLPEAVSTTEPYSFNSFEQLPIADNRKNGSLVSSFAFSLKNIFSTIAEAASVSPAGVQTLTPSNPSAAYTILWNPLVADMQVNPNAISFNSSGSMSQAEMITATGAPSAQLGWTATTTTASGGNWLSVFPASGSITMDDSGNATGTATISATSSLPGTYRGTVIFSGLDSNGPFAATTTVSVTLTVASSPRTPSVSASCDPSSVSVNGTSACSATVANLSSQDVTWTATAGSIDASGNFTAPSTAGTVSVTACSTVDPSVCGSTNITVASTIGYSCSDNACSEVSSGGVSSSSCEAACGEQQYGCVNDTCALVSSGGTSLPECQASCGSNPGFACENNACTSVSSGGVSYSSCENACGGGGGGSSYSCVNNACVLVSSGGTSLPNCEAACSGTGTGYSCVNNACKAVSSGGVSLPDCQAACGAPPQPQLSACTPGVNCPVCSPALTANPSTVVVPESSKLSYTCSNVTECRLARNDTGQMLQDIGAGSSGVIDTTQNPYAVAPTSTTAYTLACVNSNYAQNANNPISTSATVTVSGSGYCEQNPNGAGCQ